MMKSQFNRFILFITILLLPAALMAESVFLKDGSITEGRITRETNSIIIIRTGSGQETIKRQNILRIIYNNEYKKIKYIYLNNGTNIKGYIVGENRNSYIIRGNLGSPNERTIAKEDINGILNRPIQDSPERKPDDIKKDKSDWDDSGKNEWSRRKYKPRRNLVQSSKNVYHNALFMLGVPIDTYTGDFGLSLHAGYMLNLGIVPSFLFFDFEISGGMTMIYFMETTGVSIDFSLYGAAGLDFMIFKRMGLNVAFAYALRAPLYTLSGYDNMPDLFNYIGVETAFISYKQYGFGSKIGAAFLFDVETEDFLLLLSWRTMF